MPGPVLLVTESGFGDLLEQFLPAAGIGASVRDMLAVPEVRLLMHWSDFAPALRSVGVEAHTAFLGSPVLRDATERALGLPTSSDDAEHLRRLTRRIRPSTVLFASHLGFRRHAEAVRNELDRIGRTDSRIGFHATYSGPLQLGASPDFVLAATPGIEHAVRRFGAPTYLWYLQIPLRQPRLDAPAPQRSRALTFVGNTGFWDSLYRWRASVIGALCDGGLPIELFHFGPDRRAPLRLQILDRRRIVLLHRVSRSWHRIPKPRLRRQFARNVWQELESGFSARRPTRRTDLELMLHLGRWRALDLKRSSPGVSTEKVLDESLVTVNAHQDPIEDVGNLRMFEATAAGACLLSDAGQNLPDLFEDDREVVVFRSPDEAVEKARFLVENPETARRIGEAGRARYLRSHTPSARAEELAALGVLDAV